MSIEPTETEKLVFRTLAGKPFYRDSMGPVLVNVLDRHCSSDEHRRRVCDAAVIRKFGPAERQEDRCPGPAELAELCAEISPHAQRGEASMDCQYCHGDGYEYVRENAVCRCRCGGIPMSDQSRIAQYRRESSTMTPAEREEQERWKAALISGKSISNQ